MNKKEIKTSYTCSNGHTIEVVQIEGNQTPSYINIRPIINNSSEIIIGTWDLNEAFKAATENFKFDTNQEQDAEK